MKIEIYGAEWCKWCQKAKELAKVHADSVVYMDIEKDSMAAIVLNRWFQDHPNMKKTLPQIWVDGCYIGGYDMLELFLED